MLEHALRCLGVTWAASSLPEGPLKREAKRLELDRITPAIARRWLAISQRATNASKLPRAEIRRIAERSIPIVESKAQLSAIGEEAFDCASEVDQPDPTDG